MEILLKKYFWVINLVVIGICAGFAGRAAGHILEGAYLAGDDIKAPQRHAAPPPVTKLHDKNGDTIVSRDIFCSGCVPPKPVDAHRHGAVQRVDQVGAPARAGLDDGLPERRELLDGDHARHVGEGEGPGDVSQGFGHRRHRARRCIA